MPIVPSSQVSLFDGKVCTRCGFWRNCLEYSPDTRNRDGLQSACRICKRKQDSASSRRHKETRRAYRRAYEKAHRETINQRARGWRAANTEHLQAYRQIRRQANHEKVLAYYRDYRARHRAQIRMFSAAYRNRYPGRVRTTQRTYWRRYPEKKAMHAHRRRVRELASDTHYTDDQWRALCAWFGERCLACGGQKLTVDHVVPVALGGSNGVENLQPLCISCNQRKGTKSTDYRDPDKLIAFLASLDH